MSRLVLPVFLSAMLSVGSVPLAFAASSEPQLNFKIYSPEPAAAAPSTDTQAETTPSSANENIIPAMETGTGSASSATTPAETETATTPTLPATETTPTATEPTTTPTATETTTPSAETTTPMATEATPPAAAETTAAPEIRTTNAVETPTTESTTTSSTTPLETPLRTETPVEAAPAKSAEVETTTTPATATDTTTTDTDKAAASTDSTTEKTASNSKALQGYIRVVPIGTKIPIIMDTAVDSETSQEGDEFTARTSEDLNIDGGVAVPAGSIIKGRIAQMNAPKHMDRSGSVALKFDTVTTPDNRQIPLVANLVAHGGVVHAKRGLKDIAIDSGTVALPLLVGLGIGALAGNSNNNNNNNSSTGSTSKITKPEAAMIGAGIGLVVGVAILIAKKGKKVDVRPGDELKIELAEDLRMPMM